MYVVDRDKLQKNLEKEGFPSILALARHLGLHRNTVHHYLSGGAALPSALDKILVRLKLSPGEALIWRGPKETGALALAPLIDRWHERFPQMTFVLFGSRAEGRARRYSDYDIGVYASRPIEHRLFQQLVMEKNDFEEDRPFFIDLVNLTTADDAFLRTISRHWQFLSGRLQDWWALQNRGGKP